ncbi:MAG: GAF domain-containing protein [Nitrospinae bacterium]|nr:GAF domain-containing protein [Nitrospinota bacterium]
MTDTQNTNLAAPSPAPYHNSVTAINRACDDHSLTEAAKTVAHQSLFITGHDLAVIRIHSPSGAGVACEADVNGAVLCFSGLNAPAGCACGDALRGEQTFFDGWALSSHCKERGLDNVLVTPVMAGSETAGLLLTAGKTGKPISAEQREVVKNVCNLLGDAIDRIKSHKLDKNRAADLETLNHIGRLIVSRLTLKEMVREIVADLGHVLETDEVNVIRYDSKKLELSFLASFFADGSNLSRPEVYPLSDGMNSWIIKNRKPLLIGSGTVEECEKLGIRHGGRPARSWLGVPIFYKDDIVGVLSVQSYNKDNLYDSRSTDLLSAVAAQCAVAMENARLYEEALERELEKERLYFSLTHDLLSLVNPVAGFAKLLATLPPDEPLESVRKLAGSVIKSSERITRFVEDILVYAKMKSGKLALNIERRDVISTLTLVVASLMPEARFRKLMLSVNGHEVADGRIPALEPIEADFDAGQMERVFFNLLGNAVKYAASSISMEVAAEDTRVTCRFSNDGDGVDENQVSCLFDEYYQGSSRNKGVGLGLPTVKRILEMHGGQIGAESGKGKGFTIQFEWPRTLSDRQNLKQPSPRAL